MSKIDLYNAAGEKSGTIKLPEHIFNVDVNYPLIAQAVHVYLDNQRKRTANTKLRGDVRGGGRKPWKQKGTGRARAGYKQSTVWRGGATTFGPRPRDYGVKVNRKVSRLAFRRALSEALGAGAVRVVEPLAVEAPKTRAFAALLKAQGITGPVLVVVDTVERDLALAARNVPRVELVRAADVNVYQLLRYPVVLASSAGLEQLMARLAK